MIIIIKEDKNDSVEIITCPDESIASKIVELWQKTSIHFMATGKLPAISWKVSDSTDIVGAMIESDRL